MKSIPNELKNKTKKTNNLIKDNKLFKIILKKTKITFYIKRLFGKF